jgi:integrase
MALRLLLLIGARASEVCGASWDEINTGAAECVVPGERTKNGREHRIPLSEPAMEIVREAAALRTGPWLLPARGDEGHVTPSGVRSNAAVALRDFGCNGSAAITRIVARRWGRVAPLAALDKGQTQSR